jgi:hypothetical protein
MLKFTLFSRFKVAIYIMVLKYKKSNYLYIFKNSTSFSYNYEHGQCNTTYEISTKMVT